ncbi:hypothetical protein ATO3_23585 [Marinibacterium profundimaris]|uniref:Lysozyme inhibitor LprI-like N-terminal domain-containing protein n=2 Tax=Marinibacterium profundimaris TaxID=1679460 RepID=A0A225NGQ4_9RHOB|nr:hypothetical protein ATO3_23585 [Marinibacterium profundimaris]
MAIAALALCLPAMAQAACPGDTQVEMNECAAAEYKAADAELNAAWKPAKAFFDEAGHGEDLLKAQRAWIAFRDANCQAEAAPYTTGSIQPLVFSSCMERLTRQRTEDLKQMTGY